VWRADNAAGRAPGAAAAAEDPDPRAKADGVSGDAPLPVSVRYEIGELPDGNIGLRLTYATSLEKFDKGELETAAFAIERSQASELATTLQRRTRPAAPGRRRPH
jgi:hypothetical protein